MKILIAQDALHAAGGVESYMAHVIPALRARGHSVGVLYAENRSGTAPAEEVDGPRVSAAGNGLDDGIRRLHTWGADVCYSHNMAPLAIERRLLAEWPVVKFMHGYFGTCVSALKTHAFPRRVACGRTLGPACLALYAPRHCGPLRPGAIVGGYLRAAAQQRLLAEYAAVVVGSRHMAEEFDRHGVARDRLKLVPLFPTVDGESRFTADADSVLFLGRMTKLKGGDILIDAVRRFTASTGREVRLVMAGDGPQRDDWSRRAARAGVDAQFPGWLDPAGRADAIAAAAVLAVPSAWPEPFGLVGLEAAALGVPAVGFDVGGISDWLRHRISGLLVVPSGGAAAFASALREILSDPVLRARLSHGALRIAAEMSLATHVNALEAILADAARSRAKAPATS